MLETLQNFYNDNAEITIAIVVATVIAVVIKPREVTRIAGAIGIIVIVGWLITTLIDLTGSTMNKKSEAVHRTDREFQKSQQQDENKVDLSM